MKYIGQLTIEKGLTLSNPTIIINSIIERFELDEATMMDTSTSLGIYIEMYYKGESEQITHSRSYPIE
jgi:hypothetical protein|tara:strand:+ start:1729 stop:1932 length:204 start_codon:yes stop_codon:yes gene_type:complete